MADVILAVSDVMRQVVAAVCWAGQVGREWRRGGGGGGGGAGVFR
jgi:hypothetical protein